MSMIALINFSPILVIGIPYENGTVAYKRDLPNGKTLYLEYRRFDEKGNKYDNKNKKLYSCNNGDLIKEITLKSGLICYLANTGVRFPSNLNTSGLDWNMQVISNGKYATMSDCAVGNGESLYIGNGISIDVTGMTDDKLQFEIDVILNRQIACSIEGENLSVTLKSSDLGGIVLIAEYDINNTFLRLTSYSPQKEFKTSLLPDTYAAKAMLWNSLEKATPLVDPETVNRFTYNGL